MRLSSSVSIEEYLGRGWELGWEMGDGRVELSGARALDWALGVGSWEISR